MSIKAPDSLSITVFQPCAQHGKFSNYRPAKTASRKLPRTSNYRIFRDTYRLFAIFFLSDSLKNFFTFKRKNKAGIAAGSVLAFCSMYYSYLQPQPSPHPQQLSATRTGIMLQQPVPQLLKPLPPQRSNRRMIQRQSQPPDIPHSLKLFMFVPPILSRGLSHPANSQYANSCKNVTSIDKAG